jgi:hypothetical protein
VISTAVPHVELTGKSLNPDPASFSAELFKLKLKRREIPPLIVPLQHYAHRKQSRSFLRFSGHKKMGASTAD